MRGEMKLRIGLTKTLLLLLLNTYVTSFPMDLATEVTLDNLISLFTTKAPPSHFLQKSVEQDVIVDDETFKVVTLNWSNGGHGGRDDKNNHQTSPNSDPEPNKSNNKKQSGKEGYRNGYHHPQQSSRRAKRSSASLNHSISPPKSEERRRILSMTPPTTPTSRRGKALTSIQKKYWWPFNKNKELVFTRSLYPKHTQNFVEGWSSCERHCTCDQYGQCGHHHHNHNHHHHSSQGWSQSHTGINYVHHIHHNQQQQLFTNFDQGSLGGGRSNLPAENTNSKSKPKPLTADPKISSSEEIIHEKREVQLIKEKIRLKEEIRRLRNEHKWKAGVKEVHHHHGPTHLHGNRHRRRPPQFQPDDHSSSEEDDDELEKRLKIAQARKKTAKAQLLTSLLSQFGAGGLVPLFQQGISRFPNNFQGGLTGFPGAPFVSVGTSPTNRPGMQSGLQPVMQPGAANSNSTAMNNTTPSRPSSPAMSAPAASMNNTVGMPQMNAPMTGIDNPVGMPGMNAMTAAGMMAMNAVGMMGTPAMNSAGMAGMVVTPPQISNPASVVPPPAVPPAATNPAVLLAAQILLEDSLDAHLDNHKSDEESASDETGKNAKSMEDKPNFSRTDIHHRPKSKPSTERYEEEEEEEEVDEENINSELVDDSLEEQISMLR